MCSGQIYMPTAGCTHDACKTRAGEDVLLASKLITFSWAQPPSVSAIIVVKLFCELTAYVLSNNTVSKSELSSDVSIVSE
jgi:hypothetical protein